MKVVETIERNCCANADLLPLGGPDQPRSWKFNGAPVWKFCEHCGRYHRATSFTDAAGASDWHYVPQPFPWEKAA